MKSPGEMELIPDNMQRARPREETFHSTKVMRRADEMAPSPDNMLAVKSRKMTFH